MKRVVVSGALGLALALVAAYEGLRPKAYLDPIGIPTICYGHIKGVKLGDVKTVNECEDLLNEELLTYALAVEQMFPGANPKQHAAFTSFAYNVGLEATRKSGLRQKFLRGDYVGACNGLTQWVYAKGKKLPGLVKRREAERKLCLS